MAVHLILPEKKFKTITLHPTISWSEFLKLVEAQVPNYKEFAITLPDDVPLEWNPTDDVKASTLAKIKAARKIFFTKRLVGGGFSERTWTVLKNQFDTATIRSECSLCLGEDLQICQLACGCAVCYICFRGALQLFESEGRRNCSTCRGQTNLVQDLERLVEGDEEALMDVWRTENFVLCAAKPVYSTHKCRPDELQLNTTGYAQQSCAFCSQLFCFFCCEDWVPGKLNGILSCGTRCKYPTTDGNLMMPLIRWESASVKPTEIPAHRYCPFCGYRGAFGCKCKMNKCSSCTKWYCFFCLKAESLCTKTNSPWEKCGDPV
eukprot:TRINITY_DN8605_c0_g1_i2.p1 TRINITY_DN8605_c0_g1~~TRINITY_DN8605_c0_g1_i2.p1  ORF type:complete len:357 (-),score=30.71 TRINITY_DN8605_c0_g1_i2:1206-2165(-)